MPTLTLTEVIGEPRPYELKSGPAAGTQLVSHTVKDDKGDTYEISTKPGNEVKLGRDEFTITPPKEGTSFPPKLKRVSQGGGGGRGRSPEETARIERMAAHKTAAAILGSIPAEYHGAQGEQGDLDNYLANFKRVTDWLIADLPTSAPTSASPARPLGAASGVDTPNGEREGRDSATGFISEKQKNHFRRLLKQAGGSDATVGFITWYASEELSTAEISTAIDDLKDGDAKDCAKQLALAANEWSIRTGNTQPDTADLPEVA